MYNVIYMYNIYIYIIYINQIITNASQIFNFTLVIN